jgi:hypothetical protein
MARFSLQCQRKWKRGLQNCFWKLWSVVRTTTAEVQSSPLARYRKPSWGLVLIQVYYSLSAYKIRNEDTTYIAGFWYLTPCNLVDTVWAVGVVPAPFSFSNDTWHTWLAKFCFRAMLLFPLNFTPALRLSSSLRYGIGSWGVTFPFLLFSRGEQIECSNSKHQFWCGCDLPMF